MISMLNSYHKKQAFQNFICSRSVRKQMEKPNMGGTNLHVYFPPSALART
ncbi:hypothetical protein C1H46_014603 [Malus baccata]|uniref:Uncharacterized protein n=1 Tax=Malus baccata TaxID=106549 RepID=A0A540MLV9_MALBA|nr:hypothetical protein C1H46_014603 [Malus baccata]